MAKDTATSQIDKFREAARKLETDDSEERFADTVKRIGSAKPVKRDGAKPSDD